MSSRFYRLTSTARWRRSALGVLALAAAAAIVVPSALATGKTAPASKSKPPPPGTVPSNNNCRGTVPPSIAAAVARLEQAGAINSTQDQAIDAFLAQACSVNGLQPLVNNGTITAAQQQAVLNALAHAKMSLARAEGAHRQDAPAGKTAPANNSRTGAPDPVFTAAVARLAQAGTIDSTEAQAIDAHLQAGTLEGGLQQLVDRGTITAAQAQAVVNALAHAKMSLATGAHSARDHGHTRHRPATMSRR